MRLLQQDSYQPGRPFKPWFYAIATHLAYDYFRTNAPATPCLLDEILSLIWWITRRARRTGSSHGRGPAVAAAVAALGEEYQAALILRYYNGLSLQEIAEALDVPLGTVKSRLSVGTHRLRGLLMGLREGDVR